MKEMTPETSDLLLNVLNRLDVSLKRITYPVGPYLRVRDVAAMLSLSPAKIHEFIRNKDLPHYRIGNTYANIRVKVDDLEFWLTKHYSEEKGVTT